MKVLLISHTCQSLTEGLPKAQQLGLIEDIELCVLVPDRWKHYGRFRTAQKPANPSFEHRVGKVMWPWAGPGQFYLHWYPGLARLMRQFQPDIIDLWEEPWGLVSAQSCWLRNKILPRAKIICETEQNIDKRLPPPFESFRSYSLKNADYLVGRNKESIAHVRNKGYGGSTCVVPNAVDADLFYPLPAPERQRLRLEHNMSGFVAGYVGRLVEEKGLMDMLESLPLLPREANMVFIGEGPFRGALESRVRELKVADRVQFLGATTLEQLPPLMNCLDVLVLPSRTTPSWKEQFGRVLIEAGACGVPVIGSSSGAIPDVVGNAGLVFPEGDVRALAQALETLISNRDKARQMGRVGREQVEEKFTWQRVAEQMAQIYREVLHS